ncbi:MAG: class I tRNA ligase family protein, partial [Phycisphaerae bacterium]
LLVDPAFGTGVVKVTPAHDPNDYDCGQRNALPMINILTKDGRIRDDAEGKELFGAYAGMERYAARKQIVKDLEESGELEKAEPHEHPVGHSDRSKTPIEPMLSEQWFVKMAPLAEPALEAVRDERVRFFPDRYAKTYLDWLGEKRDWCISRQLWWGHRIPVWTKRLDLTQENWDEKLFDGNIIGLIQQNWGEDDGAMHVRVTNLTTGTVLREEDHEPGLIPVLPETAGPYKVQVCYVGDSAEIVGYLHDAGFEQDPDVLDTWFSSALWPHSTFGWPEQNPVRQARGQDCANADSGAENKRVAADEPPGPPLGAGGSDARADHRESADGQSRPDRYRDEEAVGTPGAEAAAKNREMSPARGVRHPDASGQDATNANAKKSGDGTYDGSAGASPSREDAGDTSSTLNPQPSTLDTFYPTNVLSTARDIISLWVARMVLTGLYNVGRVPFPHVCIHPVIQDGTGRRMSKTAGNGLDPLDLIERYGADAMRYTLAGMAGETQDARVPISYACPHCNEMTAHSSVVPHNKVPRDIKQAKCKSCGKEFATAWADDDLKAKLSVALDTSERFELGRNFCNKLWQAATGLVIPSIEGSESRGEGREGRIQGSEDSRIQQKSGGQALSLSVTTLAPEQLSLEDRWILSRLQRCIREVDRRLEAYQFSDAMSALYAFFWGEFCDWYLELVKPKLQANREGEAPAEPTADKHVRPAESRSPTIQVMAHVRPAESRSPTIQVMSHARPAESRSPTIQVMAWTLDQILRLFHPVMPFVTEALWKKLNDAAPWRGANELVEPGDALIVEAWPQADSYWIDADAEARMERLQDAIRALRDVRARVNGIRAQARETVLKTLPRAVLRADGAFLNEFEKSRAILLRLGQCDEIEIGSDLPTPPNAAGKVFTGFAVYVPLEGLADLDIERKKLAKEIEETSGHIKRTEGKLANQGFVANAPAELIERERARVAELKDKLAALQENLGQLGE